MPPIWARWAAGQYDDFHDNEHHVRSLIRDDGNWKSGNLWDLNQDGEMHNGVMITVCERHVPGEYIHHETVMSGAECAYKCSDAVTGECENFCGKGGTCYNNQSYSYWNESQFMETMNDYIKSEGYLNHWENENNYRCRDGHQLIFRFSSPLKSKTFKVMAFKV